MADVAQHAGVSMMTVSNVINKPEIVSEATRDKVLASMHALNYRNNLVARSLRLAQPRQIGYILPATQDSANTYMDRFLHELAGECQAEGRNLTLVAEPTAESQLQACQDLYYGQSAAGFVISSITKRDERPELLEEHGVPFVAYGQTVAGDDVPWNWVDVDAAYGTALAVEHLVALGHRELAFVGDSDEHVVIAARRRGYLDACRRFGLTSSTASSRIIKATDELEHGLTATNALLTGPHPPTGIVCISDLLAAGALMAVRDLGLRPGADVGVTGFDDTPLTSFGSIRITSIRQPVRELARELVRSIVDRPESPRHVLLKPELVAGSSTLR